LVVATDAVVLVVSAFRIMSRWVIYDKVIAHGDFLIGAKFTEYLAVCALNVLLAVGVDV
jgi:hypothetical protein